MSKEDKIVKYTIMPKNDNEEYYDFFTKSIVEFAKALEEKTLVAPLIIYNSDLDIPLIMDEKIEEYCVYTTKDDLLDVIRKKETLDVFRTLIIHGFDIELDEVRDVYCNVSRRNKADICINTIKPIELDSSLTFYLYNDLDQMDDEEWEEVRAGLIEDMNDYIEEYNSYAEDFKIFDDMTQDELLEFLPFFMNDVNDEDINDFYALLNQKKKDMHKKAQEIKEQPKEEAAPPVALSLVKNDKDDIEPDPLANMISCKYESSEGYVSINKLDEDLYSIEDDNYEVMLTADQIDFIVQQYNRIKDKFID